MDRIAIGKITKPVGVRGELKIMPFSGDPERFSSVRDVWIGRDDAAVEKAEITAVRSNAEFVIATLKGVGSPETAERYRSMYVFVEKSETAAPKPGRFFVDDIIGCEVSTDDGGIVGTVTDLLTLPANDLWVVRNGKKKFLIPAVKAIIRDVDISRKRITICPPEGLLE